MITLLIAKCIVWCNNLIRFMPFYELHHSTKFHLISSYVLLKYDRLNSNNYIFPENYIFLITCCIDLYWLWGNPHKCGRKFNQVLVLRKNNFVSTSEIFLILKILLIKICAYLEKLNEMFIMRKEKVCKSDCKQCTQIPPQPQMLQSSSFFNPSFKKCYNTRSMQNIMCKVF